MNKKIIFLSLLFTIYYLLFTIFPVFADVTPPNPPVTPTTCKERVSGLPCMGGCQQPEGLLTPVAKECACCGCCELIDFLKIGRGVADIILKFVGVVALVFFIIGGIMWIVASGNPERIKRGKQILVGSLIGILIVFLAWQIVNLVICAVSQGQIQPSCTIFGNKKWNVFPQ